MSKSLILAAELRERLLETPELTLRVERRLNNGGVAEAWLQRGATRVLRVSMRAVQLLERAGVLVPRFEKGLVTEYALTAEWGGPGEELDRRGLLVVDRVEAHACATCFAPATQWHWSTREECFEPACDDCGEDTREVSSYETAADDPVTYDDDPLSTWPIAP